VNLSTAYDRWHQRVYDLCPEHADESSPWYALVLEYLAPLQGKRVLEVACGRGGFVKLLASRGASVFGSDFSFAALQIGQKKIQHGAGRNSAAYFVQADAQRLPYRDGSFDVVVSCETIEHLAHPCAALGEMARVCASGGLLYLTTPNYANFMGLYEVYASLRHRKPSDFAQPLDRRYLFFQVRQFLRQSGWDILHSDGTVHQMIIPNRNPVPVQFLERSRLIRRLLSPIALHYFLIGRKRALA
jgi:ubiquinone/menaquinone biosynthesis C-methylase UbiE